MGNICALWVSNALVPTAAACQFQNCLDQLDSVLALGTPSRVVAKGIPEMIVSTYESLFHPVLFFFHVFFYFAVHSGGVGGCVSRRSTPQPSTIHRPWLRLTKGSPCLCHRGEGEDM